jgi:hypothetical protein
VVLKNLSMAKIPELIFPPRTILIVVHPGSACGSADLNLGGEVAACARTDLAHGIRSWCGPAVIIDGALSEELRQPKYADLARAIDACLDAARADGLPAIRVMGDAWSRRNQRRAVMDLIRYCHLHPAAHSFCITGCWYDPSGSTGCVNDVRDALAELGYEVEVLPGAVCEPVMEPGHSAAP